MALDDESLRAQHLFRFGIVVLIFGSAVATALGSVQAALGGGELGIGIAEGIVGAVTAGTVVYVRGRRFQESYFTKRQPATAPPRSPICGLTPPARANN